MVPLVVATALVVALIGWLRLHPFFALILGAIVAGTLAPSSAGWAERLLAALDASAAGFGSVAGAIGIAIALAAVIGHCLQASGAADCIARALLGAFGERRAAWALLAASWILAIPVFVDTVFFLLVPLARALGRRAPGRYAHFVAAIAIGGVATHSLAPPTPGPLAMADTLGIDLGTAVGFGLALGAAPAALAIVLSRRIAAGTLRDAGEPPAVRDAPGLAASLLPVLLPVVLITAASASDATALAVLGHRNAALLLGAVAGVLLLGRSRRAPVRELGPAVVEAGPIILITAAGGAFGLALAGAGIEETLRSLEAAGTATLLLAAGVAVVLKVSQGSGTVAILTGSAIMAGAVGPDLPFHPGYLFAAIGFGSMIGSWMNDSGFWVVGRLAGFSERETFRTWSAGIALLGVLGVIEVILLAALFPLR